MIMLPNAILVMPYGDDRDYIEWLYKQHHKLMFFTAWKIFRDEATVDDVVSESCVALIKNISTLRGLERNKLRVYIVSSVTAVAPARGPKILSRSSANITSFSNSKAASFKNPSLLSVTIL